MKQIKFATLYSSAKEPKRKYVGDAGIDLYLYLGELDEEDSINKELYVHIPANSMYICKTGVTVEIPDGYFGWITNKSRNDFLIGGGIVDAGYQGELLVKVINPVDWDLELVQGQAIAQLLIIPCETPEVLMVSSSDIHQDKTERGNTGGIVDQVK